MKEKIKFENGKEIPEQENWIKIILKIMEKTREKRQNATNSN